VFTEIIAKADQFVKIDCRVPGRGYLIDYATDPLIYERKVYKSLKKIKYMPVKGLIYDPVFDTERSQVPPWWFKIGPALSSSGIGFDT
jgi:hypothetical protein